MTSPAEPEPRPGVLAPAVADELPGLRLRWIAVDATPGATPAPVAARLRDLSDRGRGVDAVALRTRPVPRAYRACFRQLGLDPDHDRVPAERAVLRWLLDGGFVAGERIADACLLAVVETSVGVWALDRTAVDLDRLGIRPARSEEPGAGSLAVADAERVHASLFGDPHPGSAVRPATRAVVIYVVGVAGVPEIHLHEALWIAADALG